MLAYPSRKSPYISGHNVELGGLSTKPQIRTSGTSGCGGEPVCPRRQVGLTVLAGSPCSGK